MITLDRMFEVHAAYSLDKQLALADLLENSKGWRFDMNSGMISFGEEYSFPAQILGTESQGDGTWLWAWANTASGIPQKLLKSAEQLRAFGRQHEVPDLTQEELPLAKVKAESLAMIASGVCKADGFYRGPYPGGAIYLLLQLPENLKKAGDSAHRVASVFTEVITRYPLNHRNAFLNYLHFKEYLASSADCEVVGTSLSGEQISASFDKVGRLTRIKAVIRR
jgi:hypothetical protein